MNTPDFAQRPHKQMLPHLRALCFGPLVAMLVLASPSPRQQQVRTSLPALTGRFAVGRTSFDWVDETRMDTQAPDKGVRRELTVWVWYPASIGKSSKSAEYLPAAWRGPFLQRQPKVRRDLSRDPALVVCHSFADADVAPNQRRYPVVLVKPGGGTLALQYTALCEDLASRGYVVVASDSPYSTSVVVYADGRVVAAGKSVDSMISDKSAVASLLHQWVLDDRFILDRLAILDKSDPSRKFRGRLDLGRVGVFGHSFGGATAAEFCREDPRCKAGIDIDGQPFGEVVETGHKRPFMFLLSDHSGEDGAEGSQIRLNIKAIREKSSPSGYLATLRGAGHFSFSDLGLLMDLPGDQRKGPFGKIEGPRGIEAASACIAAFFDVSLKGAKPSLMGELPLRFPELSFEE
jgi:dienelactone hydrolase